MTKSIVNINLIKQRTRTWKIKWESENEERSGSSNERSFKIAVYGFKSKNSFSRLQKPSVSFNKEFLASGIESRSDFSPENPEAFRINVQSFSDISQFDSIALIRS